jgi:hypothetical protein
MKGFHKITADSSLGESVSAVFLNPFRGIKQ